MESKMLEIKAGLTAFFAVAGLFLGWKGVLLLVWVCSMLLDYATGSIAARKNGEWDSSVAREGLSHKGGTIAVVMVGCLFDACLALVAIHLPVLHMTWPGVIFPVVLAWYTITEMGSILENAIKMGAKVPAWLAKGLKITAKALEAAGEQAADQLETEGDK